MKVETTDLDGVVILTPRWFRDSRGVFAELWNGDALAREGFEMTFMQENQSTSLAAGTVRGLHYQAPPRAQDKLVRVTRGAIFDVAVDVRRGSATYGRWVGVELTPEDGRQMLVPKGFLHGFITRVPDTEVVYLCSDVYSPEAEGSVHFADPEIGIDWGIDPAAAIVSDKDAQAPAFRSWQTPFATEHAA